MKKKKLTDRNGFYVFFGIVGGLAIVFSLIYLAYYLDIEPEFTIYEEVCYYKISEELMKSPNCHSINVYCFNLKDFLFTPDYETKFDKVYYIDMCDFECQDLIDKCEKGNLSIYKIINTKYMCETDEMKKVCKKVEVEKMIIPKEEFLRVCYKEFDNETCQDLWIEAIKNHNYKTPSITKDKLTITWLEENCNKEYNCGLLDIEIKENSEIESIGLGKKDCIFKNYICFNNYFVGVKE